MIQELGAPPKKGEKKSNSTTAEADEKALSRKLKSEVLASTSKLENRLSDLADQRQEIIDQHAKDMEEKRKRLEYEQKQAQIKAQLALPRETMGRRAAAKRVDYKAIEDGYSQDSAAASDSESVLRSLSVAPILIALAVTTRQAGQVGGASATPMTMLHLMMRTTCRQSVQGVFA